MIRVQREFQFYHNLITLPLNNNYFHKYLKLVMKKKLN